MFILLPSAHGVIGVNGLTGVTIFAHILIVGQISSPAGKCSSVRVALIIIIVFVLHRRL